MNFVNKIVLMSAISLSLLSCTTQGSSTGTEEKKKEFPSFNADSCLAFLKAQTDMGARVPNSVSHEECVSYLQEKFSSFGATVTLQKADLTAHDGSLLKSTNIIASLNPESKRRIFIASHYDSRPWCDEEILKEEASKPVLAANDGASGVAVMLELCRIISADSIRGLGVDFICFDSEDYGVSGKEHSFCLGSQYWGKESRNNGYKAVYGILLDMVGGTDAKFYREQVSEYFAKDIVDMVWNEAAKAGHSDYFINQEGGAITDDHYYVNGLSGIPCIDIIDYAPERGFPETWHTTHDTPDNISTNTLKAVGEVLVRVICK